MLESFDSASSNLAGRASLYFPEAVVPPAKHYIATVNSVHYLKNCLQNVAGNVDDKVEERMGQSMSWPAANSYDMD